MGVCHSQLERQSSNAGVGADGDVDAVKKSQNHHLHHLPSKSTPGRSSTFGGLKVAYDLALISPSDKTDVTQMISPFSQIASPFFSPQGKKLVVGDEDDGFPSDEEFNSQDDVEDIQLTFDEPNTTEKKDDDDDDDKYRFEDHYHFNGCFLKTEEEPTYSSEETRDIREEMVDRDQFRHLCTPPDPTGTSFHNDTEIGAYPCSSPNIVTDNDNHLRSYPMASKPDHPPLLAPPKNATFSSPVPYSSTINPSTIATFNKIKTQAQQAHSLQKQHRQEEKIKDRRKDISGYKELWGEFSEIKEHVHQQQEEAVIKSPSVGRENTSLNDSTTWYVDFSALNSMNHFDHREIQDKNVLDNEDDQKSLSLLSEPALYAQKKLYQQKTAQRLKTMSAYSIGSKKGDTITAPSSNLCDNDIDANENDDDEQDDKSIFMNDNSSVISDLDNGSVIDVDNNDDYGVGVLNRYSCKSIESSVAEFQLHHQALEETDAFLSAATPRKANCATPSIFLPSVSIENSEIRWRKFPKADKKVRVARKIDFSVEDSNDKKSSQHRIEVSNMGKMEVYDVTSTQSNCESDIGIGIGVGIGVGVKPSNSDGDEGINVSFPAEEENNLEPEAKASTDHEIDGILNGYSGIILGTAIEEDECSTVEIVENEDEMSPSSKNNINQEVDKKGVKLARKIGPQLHDLLDQLKENGLGE
jgi:hypothetical protein